jgi:hypothetical protein
MVVDDGAVLVVTRSASLAGGFLRAYEVLVDGVGLAKVKRGKTVHIPVHAGPHQVQMRVDWCSSPPLQFDLPEGGEIRLACGVNRAPGGVLKQVIEDPKNYLWLRKEE